MAAGVQYSQQCISRAAVNCSVTQCRSQSLSYSMENDTIHNLEPVLCGHRCCSAFPCMSLYIHSHDTVECKKSVKLRIFSNNSHRDEHFNVYNWMADKSFQYHWAKAPKINVSFKGEGFISTAHCDLSIYAHLSSWMDFNLWGHLTATHSPATFIRQKSANQRLIEFRCIDVVKSTWEKCLADVRGQRSD